MMTATELHSWANDSELSSVWDPFLHVNNVTAALQEVHNCLPVVFQYGLQNVRGPLLYPRRCRSNSTGSFFSCLVKKSCLVQLTRCFGSMIL